MKEDIEDDENSRCISKVQLRIARKYRRACIWNEIKIKLLRKQNLCLIYELLVFVPWNWERFVRRSFWYLRLLHIMRFLL